MKRMVLNSAFVLKLLLVLTFIGCSGSSIERQLPAKPIEAVRADPPAVHWVDTLRIVDETDSCGLKVLHLLKELKEEKDHLKYSFDDYEVAVDTSQPVALDAASLKSARAYRTKITEALRDSGVNFAGHYSIVDVQMTGWGSNYWIIDRKNGRAYEFPYKANSLQFCKESNLLVMDARDDIYAMLRNTNEYGFACVGLVRNFDRYMYVTELRPFYFKWENDNLITLAPKDHKPFLNEFFGK